MNKYQYLSIDQPTLSTTELIEQAEVGDYAEPTNLTGAYHISRNPKLNTRYEVILAGPDHNYINIKVQDHPSTVHARNGETSTWILHKKQPTHDDKIDAISYALPITANKIQTAITQGIVDNLSKQKKILPLFKPNDWTVCREGKIRQILRVTNTSYKYQYSNGKKGSVSIAKADISFTLTNKPNDTAQAGTNQLKEPTMNNIKQEVTGAIQSIICDRSAKVAKKATIKTDLQRAKKVTLIAAYYTAEGVHHHTEYLSGKSKKVLRQAKDVLRTPSARGWTVITATPSKSFREKITLEEV